MQKRGLARAGRPDNGDDFPFTEVDIDAVQDLDFTFSLWKALGQFLRRKRECFIHSEWPEQDPFDAPCKRDRGQRPILIGTRTPPHFRWFGRKASPASGRYSRRPRGAL